MNVEKYQLTEAEEKLIDKYLAFYQQLATGARHPITDAQKHFVKVCHGQAPAETAHEFAYAKYMRQQALMREVKNKKDEGIPKFEEGFPRPGWSNENDWQKMKKSNYADMKKRGRDESD